MLDFKIDEQFLQTHTLEFMLPFEDPKVASLAEDNMLEFEETFYFINSLETIREGNETYCQVKANALWYRLGERKEIGQFLLTSVTPAAGLAAIMTAAQSAGLDWWPSGSDSASTALYSMDATDATYLDLIYQWAKICQCEVAFNTHDRKVRMSETVGGNYGLSFRYDRNLTQITRVVIPPKVTRLYPYGRNGLTIAGVNPTTEEYIEDYSYYTGQGLTLPEAVAMYRKDFSFQDNSFIDETSLYDAAVAKLAELAQPIISYSVSVADLSALTGLDESNIRMGDYCVVDDEPLGISVITRVVRFVRYPYEPHKNRIELSYLPIILPDPNVTTSRGEANSWELFESRNRTGARYFWGLATGILHRLPLMVTSSTAEWIMGFKMRGVGHGTANVTLSAIDLFDGSELWPAEVIPVTDGEVIHRDFTFGDKELAPGAHSIQIRVVSDTGGSGISVAQDESAFWVLARSVVEETVNFANSIQFDHTGSVQYWSPPPGVTHLHIEAYGSVGGQGTNTDPNDPYEVPGYGCYISGDLDVAPEQQLEIYVGNNTSGFAGGGFGDSNAGGSDTGGTGGGYTGFRFAGTTFEESIVVAAGGGGSGESTSGAFWVQGGNGGFYSGVTGGAGNEQFGGGTGGTWLEGGTCQILSAGGAGPLEWNTGTQGEGGNGGLEATNAGTFSYCAGGGGGGWYGGGANQDTPNGVAAGGGGGGSSWASGLSNLLFEDGANDAAGYLIISWADPE